MPRRRFPTVTVRAAGRGDLPALAALETATMADAWSPGMLDGELDQPDAVVLVAVPTAGGAAVGYASYRTAAGEGELLRLAVAAPHRRAGVATALLAAGDQALAAAGCAACFLEVREDNHGAVAFYERAGFHRIGRRRGYYEGGRDALVYARAVTTADAALRR